MHTHVISAKDERWIIIKIGMTSPHIHSPPPTDLQACRTGRTSADVAPGVGEGAP